MAVRASVASCFSTGFELSQAEKEVIAAEEAPAAGDGEGHDHALPAFSVLPGPTSTTRP
jgi:hypothetical protein